MKVQIATTLRLHDYARAAKRLRRSAEHLQHQRIVDRFTALRSLLPATDRKIGDYNTLSAKTHTDNLRALNILSAS